MTEECFCLNLGLTKLALEIFLYLTSKKLYASDCTEKQLGELKMEREAAKRMSVEKIAMKTVIAYELSQGRIAQEPKKQRGAGYDLDSGERKIEVKGTSWKWKQNKSSYQYVSKNEKETATHLYLVCDVFEKKELFIFEMKNIQHAFVEEKRYMLYFSRCRNNESDESKKLHSMELLK
jgi:hypothetical protein